MEVPESAEAALARQGVTGAKLLAISYDVAHRYARRTGSGLDSRIDDLAQYLAATGCRLAITYDPARVRPGYSFTSYVYDVLLQRTIDWHRKKSEGFGDRRYGHDNRIVLSGEAEDFPDAFVDEFQKAVDGERLTRWAAAAAASELTIREWVIRVLDDAADATLNTEHDYLTV